MARVLNVLLSHQGPAEVRALLQFWKPAIEADALLLAYGGTRENFSQVEFEPRVFIDDSRLRVRDNQRDFQSMTGVYQAATAWLRAHGRDFEFVHVAEFDHLPLVPDLNERQIQRLEAENADVLAFNLQRIDGTSHSDYLYHVANPQFYPWIASFSVRPEKEVVLSMLATGSFWRRHVFEDIGQRDEPFPIYTELYVPTLAHHLGHRLRDWAEQNAFVRNLGEFGASMATARSQGAWTLHPVKRLPSRRPAELYA